MFKRRPIPISQERGREWFQSIKSMLRTESGIKIRPTFMESHAQKVEVTVLLSSFQHIRPISVIDRTVDSVIAHELENGDWDYP